ncbi:MULTISPECIES: EndoU domain-containing protein [Clostridium]
MAALSWADFAKKPSMGGLALAAVDTVAVLPGIPSTGYFRRGAKVADKVSDGIKGAIKSKYVNLASEGRTKHILFGDKTGGGHIWPGAPGKTAFPKGWSADKIMHEVSDIVTDPTLKRTENRVIKGIQRYEVIGVRDGVKIKTITDGKDIITAYPIK